MCEVSKALLLLLLLLLTCVWQGHGVRGCAAWLLLLRQVVFILSNTSDR